MTVIPSGVRIFLQVESRDRRSAISLEHVLGISLRADPSAPPFGFAQGFGRPRLTAPASPRSLGRDDK
jgi:hypothetical protein